jgi:uncharacterized protein YcbK (DUF882 family)
MRVRGSTAVALMVALMAWSCARSSAPERAPLRFAVNQPPPAVLEAPPPPSPPVAPWAEGLTPLTVYCANSGAETKIALYAPSGEVNPDAVETFSQTAADWNGLAALKPRLVQLAFKAAYHFHATKLIVVSGYRRMVRRKGGYHASGAALDFKLPGIDYRQLGAYLRSFPRAGVGIYTNPRTQFVHLDVRDHSYHWLDASPPGVAWHEALLPDKSQETRDASYTPESDLPIDAQSSKL